MYHPAGSRLVVVSGSAADEAVTERPADLAQDAGSLAGWVNNAAMFRDAVLDSASTREVLDLIALNVEPAVVGCATAVRAVSWLPGHPGPSSTCPPTRRSVRCEGHCHT
jgi:NAD(P)-dependent dehydrogenase (short-subunit alcohol dehydrogenase family)